MTKSKRGKIVNNKLVPTEAQTCKAFMQWCNLQPLSIYDAATGLGYIYTLSDIVLHIPNGEKRDIQVAAKLKAMGVMPGVADYFIMSSNTTFHGMFLEMKRKGQGCKLSKKQKIFAQKATAQGYQYIVCDDVDMAIATVKTYLENT